MRTHLRSAMKHHALAAILATTVATAGCGSSERPTDASPQGNSGAIPGAPTEPSIVLPTGIDWIKGDVEAAFAQARAEGKPVLLYWGAEWCIPCHTLKAKVFSQPDFIEKARRFVTVYLDGDDLGAQKWAETHKVLGYPTVILLRPDRSEIARRQGGDVREYLGMLDVVLDDPQPMDDLLASLKQGTAPLSLQDCRRLAFDPRLPKLLLADAEDTPLRLQQRLDLQPAIDRCPAEARVERARLTALYSSAVARLEGEGALKRGEASPRLKQAMRSLLELQSDPRLARAVGDIVPLDEEEVFDTAERLKVMDRRELRQLQQRWIAALEADADDPTVPAAERLRAIVARLVRTIKQNPKSSAPIPKPLADDARDQATLALQNTPPAAPERAEIVERSKAILALIGDTEGVRKIVAEEIKVSPLPYFYMSQMGYLVAARGNTEEAIKWFKLSYRESQGIATRFQWGASYVKQLLQLRPEDESAIREAAIEVLGELEGPGRIYGHTRNQLAELDASLRKWNVDGKHAQAMVAIRSRMAGICAKIPASEVSARQACERFLAD